MYFCLGVNKVLVLVLVLVGSVRARNSKNIAPIDPIQIWTREFIKGFITIARYHSTSNSTQYAIKVGPTPLCKSCVRVKKSHKEIKNNYYYRNNNFIMSFRLISVYTVFGEKVLEKVRERGLLCH